MTIFSFTKHCSYCDYQLKMIPPPSANYKNKFLNQRRDIERKQDKRPLYLKGLFNWDGKTYANS